jgi:prevent-host-death family protein
MTNQTPSTQTIDSAEIKTRLEMLLDAVAQRESRVLVERSGTLIAAVISIEDLRRLERLDRQRASRLQAIAEISAAFADVPLDEIEAQVSRIAAEGPTLDEAEAERRLA